jgi:hypothetical protein
VPRVRLLLVGFVLGLGAEGWQGGPSVDRARPTAELLTSPVVAISLVRSRIIQKSNKLKT